MNKVFTEGIVKIHFGSVFRWCALIRNSLITLEANSVSKIPAVNIHHRRRNQGGRGGHGPPRFQNICFRPPPPPPRFQHQILTNIGWKSLLSMYYIVSSSVTFRRVFCCGHSYVEFQELIHNHRLPILFRPPQVMTCSSASVHDIIVGLYCQNNTTTGQRRLDTRHIASSLPGH